MNLMDNWDEKITLIHQDNTKDKIGNPLTTKVNEVVVWAKRQPVTRSDFYESGQAGIRLEEIFVIHPYEYSGQNFVLYNNKRFRVVRTYEKDLEEMELHLEEKIGER